MTFVSVCALCIYVLQVTLYNMLIALCGKCNNSEDAIRVCFYMFLKHNFRLFWKSEKENPDLSFNCGLFSMTILYLN